MRAEAKLTWLGISDRLKKKVEMSIESVSWINCYVGKTKITGGRCGNQGNGFKF